MHIRYVLVLIVTALYAHVAAGSQIAPTPLANIAEESAIVVVGVVERVDKVSSFSADGTRVVAHVRIVSLLRGNSTATTFALPLHTGGLMGFDTELAEGDQAVFFLRSIDAGTATLQSWGSVARLPAGYFSVD